MLSTNFRSERIKIKMSALQNSRRKKIILPGRRSAFDPWPWILFRLDMSLSSHDHETVYPWKGLNKCRTLLSVGNPV